MIARKWIPVCEEIAPRTGAGGPPRGTPPALVGGIGVLLAIHPQADSLCSCAFCRFRSRAAPNDPDRLSASAELHEPCELLAPSAVARRLLVAGLLPAHRTGARARKVRSRLLR